MTTRRLDRSALSGSVLMLLALAPALPAQEVVEDYSWAMEHHAACSDRLLGSHEHHVGDPFSTTAVATVRVVADDCGERQVALIAKASEGLEVHVTRIMGEPILEQLFSLHEAAPTKDAAELCARIPVKTAMIEGSSASRFRPHLEELGERNFALLPEHVAAIHGSVYSVWITSGDWNAHIAFSGPRGPENRHKLAAWAEALLGTANLQCGVEE